MIKSKTYLIIVMKFSNVSGSAKSKIHLYVKTRDNSLNSIHSSFKFQGWEGLRTKKQYINSTPKNSGSTVKTVQTVHIKL